MSAIMFQGTGSNVGKSLLVAGLCRAVKRRGLSVAPFKPQNMSNNAAVTSDGGEIGRAQALQAQACQLLPHTDMNPILLKPETETGAQVIIHGKRHSSLKARDYAKLKPQLMAPVLESFQRLKTRYDLVIVEGAGSPAEINLRANDIANMGFALAGNVPVIITGDIDRGGIIAQLVGTHAVLSDADRAQISGFIVNKFRGDVSLFDDGYQMIADRTGWPGFGVLPYFSEAWRLPAEDAQDIGRKQNSDKMQEAGEASSKKVKIVCLCLSRMANFDDLDPLAQENGVELITLQAGQPLPGDADLVLIPGSKSTIGDLAFLRAQGWDVDLTAHHRRGGKILGICGGYQMLGKTISDPDGVEGPAGTTAGLGFLDVHTRMTGNKTLTDVRAIHSNTALQVSGYEIHIGQTTGPDCARPFAQIDGRSDGAISADGSVTGSYLHGMFRDDAFRASFLKELGAAHNQSSYDMVVDTVLDALSQHIEAHLDVDGLLDIAR